MSMPNIPDITPEIDLSREDVITLLLASVALEEIGLGHIANAEAEKIQKVLQAQPCGGTDTGQLLAVNESVGHTLDSLTRMQMLLQMKMEDILRFTSTTATASTTTTSTTSTTTTATCTRTCTHTSTHTCTCTATDTRTCTPPCPPVDCGCVPDPGFFFHLEGCGEGYTDAPCTVARLTMNLRFRPGTATRGFLRLAVRAEDSGSGGAFCADTSAVRAVFDGSSTGLSDPLSLTMTGSGVLARSGEALQETANFTLHLEETASGTTFRMRAVSEHGELDTGAVEVLLGGFRVS